MEFSQAANRNTQIKVLCLDKKDVLYPQLDYAFPIAGTLKIHHMKRDGTTLIFKLNSPYDITDEPNFKTVDYSSSSLRDNLPQPEA